MVAPFVTAVSKVLGHFPPKEPLDREETAGGTQAFAALMYQEGMKMNAWALVGMWGLGVGSFRVIKYFDEKDKKANESSKVITGQEMAARLRAERENGGSSVASNPNSHAQDTPVNGHAARVTVGGSASETPVQQEKPNITAEQAVAIIKFPGEAH